MKIVETVAELRHLVEESKGVNKTVGFVPTMGALHQGHVSLVKQCRENNDICIVSVFVNPTQFNNLDDLKHYPRSMEQDCSLLEQADVDYVFVPTVNEVYPEEDKRNFDFGNLDKVMEGEHRPGHFNGVAQVVSRLFDIVQPDRAYFGEKDFQQLVIIKAMVKQLNLDVAVIPCPIVREDDGLALSSRNRRLSSEHRIVAPLIYRILKKSKALIGEKSVEEIKQFVIDNINAEPLLNVEYFDIVDVLSLQEVKNWSDCGDKVGCIVVFAGDVRLIDNIIY